MTSRRSQSYGRVMETLHALGPTKLQAAEQEQIRDAADALLFCEDLADCPDAREALAGVTALARHLVETDRWLADSADALIDDVAGCGPVVMVS